MTSHPITVPSNDQLYSLVADLNALAIDVSTYLDVMAADIKRNVSSGESVDFTSIVCSGTGSFSQITITSPTHSVGKLSHVGNYFGMTYGNTTFLSSGTRWISSVPVVLPSGTAGGDTAVSYNYLFNTSVGIATGRLIPIENTVKDLPTNYVPRSVYNTAISTLNTEIANLKKLVATKANHTGDVSKVSKAGTADLALDSNLWQGFKLAVGSSGMRTMPAGQSSYFNISYAAFKGLPYIFAQAMYDNNAVSIVCSIENVTETSARINYRNIGSNAETANIHWLATGYKP